jgi:hypothetical protein
MPKCFQLHTPPLRHLTIWLVESSEARIWRHHRQELGEFPNPGMLFEEGRCPVDQMGNDAEIYGMQIIQYDHSLQRDAFHIPQDTF